MKLLALVLLAPAAFAWAGGNEARDVSVASGDLRGALAQQRQAGPGAPAVPPRQLSPEERQQLRRQLAEYGRSGGAAGAAPVVVPASVRPRPGDGRGD